MDPDPQSHGGERLVLVDTGTAALEGNLAIPEAACGLVLFAHGSGSSRHSRRNRYVAETLRERGLATLLIDLLTADEETVDESTRQHRFDIPMLADRLLGTINWLAEHRDTERLRIGLFGASTGGGAALMAAAQRPGSVAAVVSRGGRPDLAGELLRGVECPTLLIVGGRDDVVLQLNRQALEALDHARERQLAVVPGATHLFEEPGALAEVARLAADWFTRSLGATECTAVPQTRREER
jgi:pimeloyl-ACP methyl ester carboxylesterase